MTSGRHLAVLLGLAVLAGCDAAAPADTAPADTAPAGTASPATGPGASAPACPPDHRYTESGELAGTPGVMWGLLFLHGDGVRAGEQVKIALRVTGSGELALRADGPRGTSIEPVGYDRHSGSNWARPGDEWGSYWVFPAPGCWTIRAARTDGTLGALTIRAG